MRCSTALAAFAGLVMLLCAPARGEVGVASGASASRSPQAASTHRAGHAAGFRVLKLGAADASQPLNVALWYPTSSPVGRHVYGGSTAAMLAMDGALDGTACPCPLLMFSHGYGGSGLGIAFLAEALAARGWIVASPDHHDRYSAVRIESGQVPGFERGKLIAHALEITRSSPADREQYLWRIDELRAAVNGVLADADVGPAVDRDRMALGGHSLGGFTALGLSGTLPERVDGRFKALLLFSTGAGGYLFTPEELHRVALPTLLMSGEKERAQKRGKDTMEEISRRIYDNLAGPKYFIEIAGATHFSFNNRFSDTLGARLMSGSDAQLAVIRGHALAFLDRHVNLASAQSEWMRPDRAVSRQRSDLPTPASPP